VLYSVLSIFPIIDVADWRVFSTKIVAVIVGTELVGLAIFMRGRRRQRSRGVLAESVPTLPAAHAAGERETIH
jgi:hypothetical protein